MTAFFNILRRFASNWFEFGRRRRKQDMRLLRQSGLFNDAWYLEAYPDVRESGVDPLRHYLDSGWREGRDPGPNFSSSAYLKGNSDVAALGVNPLLHFVEYGHAEGRGTPEFGAPTRSSIKPLEEFGPAAPCFKSPLPTEPPVPWKRGGRIDASSGRPVTVEDKVVAILPDDVPDARWHDAAEQMNNLASWTESAVDLDKLEWGRGLLIADAWDAGRGILRFRWRAGSTPLVVRAVRRKQDRLVLAGETMVGSELDVLDVRGAADLGPILFLFTTAEGVLLGTQLLMFPGLCRGALHYAEFLAMSHDDAADLASVDRKLRDRLVRLRNGGGTPLVSGIVVDVDECDGTQPLFDRRYRSWLSGTFGISISAAGTAPQSTANAYLEASVSVPTALRSAGSALKLHGGMIPTISALVAAGGTGTNEEDVLGSLIVSAEEPAQPSTHVRVPGGMRADGLPGQGAGLPRLSREAAPEAKDVVATALQVPKHRVPTEAELLFPAPRLGTTGDVQKKSRVSWLIWPGQWKADQLADALEALALQSRTPAAIFAIGSPPRSLKALPSDAVHVARNLDHALSLATTELAGYLGPGIILHDRRTVDALEEIVDSPTAMTASPEMISVETRGSGWMVKPAAAADLHRLPRMILPLADPPRDMWIARTRDLTEWVSGKRQTGAGSHFCTSHVTASRLGGSSGTFPIDLPPADPSQAIVVDLLVG